jgi:NAD(P)-dependent dehydrogenase (short-subunit alcohol dehydrogenase family)
MTTDRKTAIVTGAASGIGRATVLRLVGEGLRVVAVDLDESGLEAARSVGADALVADVASEEGCASIVAAGDGADHLVNAAGIIRLTPILDVRREEWRDLLRVNAESTFFLCQQLGPKLRPGGAIVNLSSVSAKLPATPETAAYAASKAAIISITRSFAYALAARQIRVNAICPGIIETPMQDKVLDEVARLRGITRDALSAARTATVPLARGSSPEECAGLISFLLSDASSYMTGEAVNFSGGMAMW